MSRPVILCVDDEKIVLDSLKSQLKENMKVSKEFDIEIAESADEALEILDELLEEGTKIPVVISDHIMPGMKGDELLINIKKITPSTLKILLTGQADADAVGNAVNNAELYRYIAKPWDSTDLILTATEAYKSFFQSQKLEEQNIQLKKLVQELEQLNSSLEQKVRERTEQIQKQKNEIEKKNRDITDSINYARRIQDNMLPSKELLKKTLNEYCLFFRPKDIISGDFYTLYEKGNEILIAAVDCTGHGVPGAIMSMIALEQMREIIDTHNIMDTKLILESLHKNIRRVLKQGEGENRETIDLAICTIDKEKKILKFSGARNPLIYVHRNREGIPTVHHIRADRKSVGGIQKEKERVFTRHEIPLDSSSINFYIFSDGFQDQFGGRKSKKFMLYRLKELFRSLYEKPLGEQEKLIEEIFNKWKGSSKQIDDVLLIGFKIS